MQTSRPSQHLESSSYPLIPQFTDHPPKATKMVSQAIGTKKAVPVSTGKKTPIKAPNSRALQPAKKPVPAPYKPASVAQKKPAASTAYKKPLPAPAKKTPPQQQGWLSKGISAASTGIGNAAGAVVSAAGNGVAGAGKGAGSSYVFLFFVFILSVVLILHHQHHKHIPQLGRRPPRIRQLAQRRLRGHR